MNHEKVTERKEGDDFKSGMDMKSRNQFLNALLKPYLKAEKDQKGQLLDENWRDTSQNRKCIILKIARMATNWTSSGLISLRIML